jgi:hypothetical protein
MVNEWVGSWFDDNLWRKVGDGAYSFFWVDPLMMITSKLLPQISNNRTKSCIPRYEKMGEKRPPLATDI